MRYLRVEFENAGIAYQEVDAGFVLRYVDDQGTELFVDAPVGDGCRVLEDDFAPTPAMVQAADARAADAPLETSTAARPMFVAYDPARDGERRTGPADRRAPR